MYYPMNYSKYTAITLVCLLFILSKPYCIIAQQHVTYPELELYNKTLEADRMADYNKALMAYYAKPPEESLLSKNKKLADRYLHVMNDSVKNDPVRLLYKINALWELSDDAKRKKEINLSLECLFQAFVTAFWTEPCNYSKAFEIAIELEKRLSEVAETHYPEKRTAYFRLGEAYYLFQDYRKSIELLKQAITDNPPRSFTDCANLDARKVIGICYANINRMDSSDYYFLSTLRSPDIVLNRPVYNAIAVSHLGCNAMLKGEYEKALTLDLAVQPFIMQTDDYGHIAGMYACQCFSYFALNRPEKVGAVVDSLLHYADKDLYNRNKRLKQAYSILARYYAVKGDIDKIQQYNDSLLAIYQKEDMVKTSQYIFQARQSTTEKELLRKEKEMKSQHLFMTIVSIAFFIITSLFVVIFLLYRKQQAAYKALVEKSDQWANSDFSAISHQRKKDNKDEPDEEDLRIAEKLHMVMIENKPYKDYNLTIETLSDQLDISRNKLSRAINRSFGKNFSQYINEYRVREAIHLMADPQTRLYSMDELMEMAGFNGRTSFYRLFKQITGLSPAEYRKSRN